MSLDKSGSSPSTVPCASFPQRSSTWATRLRPRSIEVHLVGFETTHSFLMASLAHSNNPLNQEYLEYFQQIKSSFQQCTYYIRKEEMLPTACWRFHTKFCSLHTPEGLARERRKVRDWKIYNSVVNEVCKVYLKEICSWLVNTVDCAPEDDILPKLCFRYQRKKSALRKVIETKYQQEGSRK